MMNSENLLRRLRTTLDRPDTVLLVGSGISLWSGLPTWERLLTKLAEFVEGLGRDARAVRQEIEAGDLLLAASYAVYQLDLRELGAFIRQATNYPNAKPAEIHRLIATLGPSCFITTNYDRLLEIAITESGPAGTPAVVTNRQVAEIADILPSYARRFVFKYHGDVEDAASIVLTRDQYRRIQHEYPATTRAFGTLLATRPVVMIGFGLRDLDFLALKDELVAAFDGQVGEYFAIMPDFDQVRAEYWRKTYRTEIISYDTIVSNGSRDHTNLLKLLKSLQPSRQMSAPVSPSWNSEAPSEFKLRLARLAASIVRKKPASISEFLPLTVSAERSADGFYSYYDPELSKLLKRFKHNFLLLGPPGSGKSFALANYAVDVANNLLEQCIQEQPIPQGFHIPVIVHLAIYAGDLRELIQGSLPTGLELFSLLKEENVTIILDGVNEIPREFIESGKWISDFQELVSSATNCRFILGSRNETWLSSLNLTRFNISDISFDYVSRRFSSLGKNPELIRTLSKPLFFSLASSNRIDLSAVTTPGDIYANFFSHIDSNWLNEGRQAISFAAALERVAFKMLEAGAEFAAKAQFSSAFLSLHLDADAAEGAISFLLAQGVLVALAGHRLSFFHQSATEYLAAKIIADQFLKDKQSLRKRLQDKRWDQALFLAMSFLDENFRQRFLDEILTTDLAAGARASHYLELNKEEIINEILLRAASRTTSGGLSNFTADSRLEHQLELLPYTQGNIDALKRLSECTNSIGGGAAGALFVISDQHSRIIDEVLNTHDDWNYVQTFAGITNSFWSDDDLNYLLDRLRQKEGKLKSSTRFGELFYQNVPTAKLLSWCDSFTKEESAAKYALIEALRKVDAREARSILLGLVAMGQREAIYSLYSNLNFDAKDIERDELRVDRRVTKELARSLASEEDGEWAVLLARKLIEKNPDWKSEFKLADVQDANARFILEVICGDETSLPNIITAAVAGITNLDNYTVDILGDLDFWTSAPVPIVLDALCSRNPFLGGGILGQMQGKELPLLSVRPLDWWLEWEEECLKSKIRPIWWCGYMIGRSIKYGDSDTRSAALTRLNESSTQGFEKIGRLVFADGAGKISTEQLSETAIIRLLNKGRNFKFSAAVLGNAATEEFVRTVMLPHIIANPDHNWVRNAIEIAGNRHNRRYLVSLIDDN